MSKDNELTYKVKIDQASIKKEFKDTTKVVETEASNWKNIIETSAGAVGGAYAQVGVMAAEELGKLGKQAINSSTSMHQAMDQFIDATGKGKDATQEYQKVLEKIYVGNYGDSFEDIAQAMAAVDTTLGDMSGGTAGLEAITKSAFDLQDAFGYDITDSVSAAKELMTQFGIDGNDAMALISAGAQNGLDSSGQLLDTISQYAGSFAQVGLDADDMFKIMQAGADSGKFSFEQIGTAVQEMSDNIVSGSESSRQGFETLGLNADDMAQKFAAGGDTAKEAFRQTIDALAQMEDPMAQNAAGVDLFGSKWEELGPDVIEQLAGIQDGAYDTTEAMGGMQDTEFEDLGSSLEELQRSLELLLIPIGDLLVPLLSEIIDNIMPVLQEVLPIITEGFGKLLEPLMSLVQTILPPLCEIFSTVISVLFELLGAVLPPLIDAFKTLIDPIMKLIQELLPPLIDLFKNILMPAIQAIMPVIETLASIFSSVLGGAIDAIMPIVHGVIDVFKDIIDFITGIFSGDWDKAWNAIVDTFKGIFNLIPTIAESIINLAIDAINGITWGISQAWTWLGIPSIPKIPHVTIPRLKAGIDFVPNDYFPAFLDQGERVLTKEENSKYNALGGLAGMEMRLSGNLAHQAAPTAPVFVTLFDENDNKGPSQTVFNFYQPVESPDTTARAVRRVLTHGLAGDR